MGRGLGLETAPGNRTGDWDIGNGIRIQGTGYREWDWDTGNRNWDNQEWDWELRMGTGI